MNFEKWYEEHVEYMTLNDFKPWMKEAWLAGQEEAAKVCDGYAENSSNPMNFSENCAAAIRALK